MGSTPISRLAGVIVDEFINTVERLPSVSRLAGVIVDEFVNIVERLLAVSRLTIFA